MRSKICRAKRKDNKEWVEGYYFCMVHDDKRHEHHFIIPIGADLSKGTPIEQIQVEIDIDTLCDDTGLTDKNGRKIWENDILMCHGNKDDLIKAVFGKFDVIDAFDLEVIDRVIGWHYKVIPTDGLSRMRPFNLPMPLTDSYVESLNLKVIGNAFDNPELLEKAR